MSADYLGAAISATQLTFPDDGRDTGCVEHPFAESDTATPLIVCGTPGDVLLVLPLPFGSYVPTQPASTIDLKLDVSALADLGVGLPVHHRAGFRFGADPLDNACCDPSLVSAASNDSTTWPSTEVTPELLAVRKEYLGPENETSTGPNFPRQYRIVLDLADGQSISDVDVIDDLPDSLAYLRLVSTSPTATVLAEPTVGEASSSPTNRLHVNFSSVTGTASNNDAEVVLEFFVPRTDATGSAVVPAASGDDTTAENQVTALGDWSPVDGRDPSGTDNVSFDASGPEHTLSQQALSIQKGVAIAANSGASSATPGDVLEYTLEIQVSDFFAVSSVVVTDVLSDGQSFDQSFTPTLRLTEHGSTTSAGFDAANFTVSADKSPGASAPNTGRTTLTFDLSSELVARGADALFLGGCVPVGGTGGTPPDCSTFDQGATTATVVFRAVIDEDFSDDFPSGDASVDQGDSLSNDAVVDSVLHDVVELQATAATEADDTAAGVKLVFGSISKSIYAIDGNTSFAQPIEISPGDEITYRLEVTMPSADFENLVLSDYLPLPVFSAPEVTQLLSQADATVPAAGTIKFGAMDTLLALAGAPSWSVQAASNRLVLDYGDFDAVGSGPVKIDVLFTVTVSDEPFADDLLLTNQMHLEQASTNGGVHVADAIVQFRLRQPLLRFTKGAISSDQPDATFTPSVVGPSLVGTVSSDDLAATPVGSDVADVDAGDLVTFALVVENVGGSGAFDLVVNDALPAGLTVPAGGIDLTVRRGDGLILQTSALGPFGDDRDLFENGLEIVDPSGEAACQEYSASGGSNVVLLTYELEVADAAAVPEAVFENDAGLLQYGGDDGSGSSANHVFGTTEFRDSVSIEIATPQIEKDLTLTSEPHTPDSDPGRPLAIGEAATYRIVVTVPEGVSPQVKLTDQVSSGVRIESVDQVTATPGLSTSVAGGFGAVRTGAVVSGDGRGVTLDFGDLTNANRANGTADTISVYATVRVQNDPEASSGTAVTNSATWSWDGGQVGDSAQQALVVEPALEMSKDVSPGNGDAGDTVSFTLTVTHAGASTADAFDLVLTDALSDPDLALVDGTVSAPGGTVVRGNGGEGDVEVRYDSLALAGSAIVTFDGVLLNSVVAGDILTNVAELSWDSLPGEVAEREYGPTSAGAQVTIGIPDLSKSVLSTSETSTDAAQYSPTVEDLTLGEEVTFRIVATLPEGVTAQVLIVDSMPSSASGVLEAISAQVISVGGSLTPAVPSPTPSFSDVNLGDGLDDRVSFDFGQVTNAPDGVVSAGDQIVLEIVARVADVAANRGGRTLTNTALIDFDGALQPTATVDVEVVEPLLEVDKSGDETTGDAGDIVRFVVEVRHDPATSARAFDVLIEDELPPGLSFYGNLQSTGTAEPSTLSEASNTVTAVWDELDVGEVGRFEFDAIVDLGVFPGENLTNEAMLSWDSLPADDDPPGERTGSDSDEHVFTVTLPGVDKTVFSTSESFTGTAQSGPEPDLTIGEQVTYRVVLTLPEGTVTDTTIVDQLPKGSAVLALESSRVVRVGTALGGAGLPSVGAAGTASDTDADGVDDRVQWTLGTVVNTPDGSENAQDEIEVEVVARVIDVAANSYGDDDLVNLATLSHADGSAMDSALVDVVEPQLQITKSASSTLVDAGDTIRFDLQIDHISASSADAFSLVVVDALPSSGLSWAGNGTVVSDCDGLVVDSTSLPTVRFDVSELTRADETCTISYDLDVENTVQPAQSYDNTASLDYDSQPTYVAGETRRRTTSDMETVTILAPGLMKITDTTSLDDTGMTQFGASRPDLAIGEQVDYELTVVFPEGVTENAVVTDLMPADSQTGIVEVIGASVSSIGGQLVATGSGSPVLSDTRLDDGLNDTVTFDFGRVTNTPDGSNTPADRIVLTVTGVVVDLPENVAGDVLSNYAELAFATGGPLSDTAEIDVVEPELELGKSMGPMAAHRIPISLSVENTGSAPAYEVRVEDVLDDSLYDLDSFASIAAPTGFVLEALDEGSQLRIVLRADPASSSPDNVILPGETVSADFEIDALRGASSPSALPNAADEVGATTLPGTDPKERDASGSTVSVTLDLPILESDKTASLLADADNSGTVSPGDTVRYEVALTNSGAGAATDLVLQDTPDANTSLVIGTVVVGGSEVVVSGNGAGDVDVHVTLASLAAGQTSTVQYDVVVAPALAAGIETVTNQGVWTSTEVDPVATDDPSVPGFADATIVPVDAAPDLGVSKTDGDEDAIPTGLLTYQVTYANGGNQDATGVTVTETVPDHSIYLAPNSNYAWSCPDGSPAGTQCVANVGSLAAGAGGSFTFAVRVVDPLPGGVTALANTVTIQDDGSNGDDLDLSDNQGSDTTPINASPGLTLTKSDGDAVALFGSPVVYTLSYSNDGNQVAQGVVLTETVPADTIFDAAASAPSSWSCGDASSAGTECTLSLGQLAVGASGSETFAVRTLASAGEGGLVQNTATIRDDGSGASGQPVTESASDTTPVRAPTLTKTLLTSGDLVIGQEAILRIEVGLPEGASASGVTLVDALPPELLAVRQENGSASAGLTYSGSLAADIESDSFTWTLGDVSNTDGDSGTQESFVFDVVVQARNVLTAQAGTMLTTTATLTFGGQTRDASVDLSILEPDLSLDTSFDQLTSGPGETVTVRWEIAHTQASGASAHDLELVTVLPEGLTYAGGVTAEQGPAPTVDATGLPELRMTVAELEQNWDESNPLVITFDVTTSGSLTTRETVDSEVRLEWSSIVGVPALPVPDDPASGERTGDSGDPGGAANDYVAESTSQLNNTAVFSFEDLREDETLSNDFDYNDFVITVGVTEEVNEENEWTRIELLVRAEARGAAFNHEPFLDVGLEGPIDITLETYDAAGVLTGISQSSQNATFVESIPIFADSYTALPSWQGGSFPFTSNTDAAQTSANRVDGLTTRVILEVGDPSLNPRVVDDPETLHLDEATNHLLGPWIRVLNTGQEIYQRWRHRGATQDLVTAELYGSSTPLLGFGLDQATIFEAAWSWPVEQEPIWDAYPEFVDYTYSGSTSFTDWFDSPASGLTWPVSGANLATLRQGSTVTLPQGSFAFTHVFDSPLNSAPAVADLDRDGSYEVVVGSFLNWIAVHGADGALQTLIDPAPGQDLSSVSSVVVADLLGDASLEILRGYDDGVIRVFDASGDELQTFQLDGTVKSTPVVGDVDGNGSRELFVLGGDARLYGFSSTGAPLPGFPLAVGGPEDVSNNWVIMPSPLLANVDESGSLEVVAVTASGRVHVVGLDGQSLPGWPVDLERTVLASPAAANLDGSGGLEIVIADDQGGVAALGSTGVVVWESQRSLGGPSSPAVGDLEGDGSLEVVVGSMDGRIYAYAADGSEKSGWPVTTASQVQSSPSLVDFDDDGDDEVFVGSFDTRLYGLDGDGSALPLSGGGTFPVALGAVLVSSPAVVDLQGDGTPEIVVGSYDRNLYAVEAGGSVRPLANLWGQFRGSAANQGTASESFVELADLSVAVDDNVDSVVAGTQLNWTVLAQNAGPDDVLGATLQATVSPELSGLSWSCSSALGACGTANGSGAPDLSLDLPSGASATITVQATVASSATGTVPFSASIGVPAGFADSATGNNESAESTPVELVADVGVTISDGSSYYAPGSRLRYTVAVSNDGPSDAFGTALQVALPEELSSVSWTCSAGGGASCAASGSGAPDLTLDLPEGALAVFSVSGDVDPDAVGVLTASATVSVATGISDPVSSNDVAFDESSATTQNDAPTVETVTSLSDDVLEACRASTEPLQGLRLLFSEPMRNSGGSTSVGDLDNPQSYLLVSSGADRDLQTVDCSGPAGDDQQVALSAVYAGAGSTSVSLEVDDLGLLDGAYRLFACSTLEDQDGTVIDGDGDGFGGDSFRFDLRVDSGNLVTDGHFDCDLGGWQVEAPPSELIFDATTDADDAQISGSAAVVDLTGAPDYTLSRCLPVEGAEGVALRVRTLTDAPAGVAVDLKIGCEVFSDASCSGSPLLEYEDRIELTDSSGAWNHLALTAPSLEDALSARCAVAVEQKQGFGFEVRFDQLFLQQGIFENGFEKGMLGWSEKADGP
ncbi:MAG: LruC domain-containing protein [Acidobacteriota bacterium]